MKLVIQRVTSANIVIDKKEKKSINQGLVVLFGFGKDDNENILDYYVKKIINLRIFEKNNKLNLSVRDINGDILLVSQFTLYANTKNGNRPSFEEAMKYDEAKKLNDVFIKKIKNEYERIETGKFGSDMQITLTNDGPVTIIM